ncbi:helix-turn-helix domain-containing GNAT family N-acetyltransferase [Nocardia terpenica]|uniref:MarR family transcriptional regulator n=1 Tax=Nocardia terpenica TaxID=455432 RepID=A0A164MV73_9NOCA|nr:helix-turn-helix domain-containing GNAT family N-acetyltransferase [Nocardia terpenica]KZM73694.1 MarR family transcriptional regulator [Nocardia terpenica]NQE87073.1 MarR family transcriptional regulator [Nocardia terpenica]
MSAPTISVDHDHIAAVRDFNRRYTRLIGVLGEGLHDSQYSLTEVRILFELNRCGPTEVASLRRALDLDAGYLSRILSRFERDGLVSRQRSATDGRRQEVRLTEHGETVFAAHDAESDREVGALLDGHSPATRHRLIGAMRTIGHILDRPAAEVVLRAPRPGDHGWVIQRHAELYGTEYGWDASYETLIVEIVHDFLKSHDETRERAWIAEFDGEPVGSIYCVADDDTTARLRLLLVEPAARGLGVGSALVDQCLRFAAAAGYTEMVLWTNDILGAARRIYERAGFELVESTPHHSFGADLVGQTWRKPLT